MAKAILLKVLNDNLGAYIEGLTSENLHTQVFGGEIELRHARLKPDGLDSLQLPINIDASHLGRLTISIPWSTLSSAPVVVTIHDIFLVCSPKGPERLSKAELDAAAKKMVKECVDAKRKAIEDAEALRQLGGGEEEGDGGYFGRLTKRIVDNLQVPLPPAQFSPAYAWRRCRRIAAAATAAAAAAAARGSLGEGSGRSPSCTTGGYRERPRPAGIP